MAISPKDGSPHWRPQLLGMVRIAIGLLFLEHGLSTAFGFATGRADHDWTRLHAYAGPIETMGGILLILGLFTRTTGFILSGEMAIAYFQSRLRWDAGPLTVLWPHYNNGEEAVLNAFFFLWLVTAGAGAWSLDALIEKRRKRAEAGVGTTPEPVRT